MIKYLLFFSLFISFINSKASSSIEHKGFRVQDEFIAKDYKLLRLVPSEGEIQKFIIESNYKIKKADAENLAAEILKISLCFEIDPWIFTSLIKKESSFEKSATSITNAVGLTQFTGIGIVEVNDQLGIRGKDGAFLNSIQYFNNTLKSCVDENWVHLWDKVTNYKELSADDQMRAAKAILLENPRYALVYGAVLLKTYVAISDQRNTNPENKLSQLYFNALMQYNGEPGDAKIKYAEKIFSFVGEFYPKELNFNFFVDSES